LNSRASAFLVRFCLSSRTIHHPGLTAKALDLDVPWFLQQRADEMIE
jgi:hypothetical protein